MMRRKYLYLLLLISITAVAFFYFSNDTISAKTRKIGAYDRRIKQEQEKLNSAKVLNEQLQLVSKVIMNSMTSEKKFSSDEVNSFIKILADLADKYQIAVYSLFPKVISSLSRYYLEQLYTMELNCTFIQMGQFLGDLESFDHIIKVKTLDVRPVDTDFKETITGEAPATRYKVTIELSVYKIVKEA